MAFRPTAIRLFDPGTESFRPDLAIHRASRTAAVKEGRRPRPEAARNVLDRSEQRVKLSMTSAKCRETQKFNERSPSASVLKGQVQLLHHYILWISGPAVYQL
jgi:hypothetical protein